MSETKENSKAFQPIKSESGNHRAYRIENDGTLTIEFAGKDENSSVYNYPDLEETHRNEYVRRAPLEGPENSNGKYFAAHIRKTRAVKLS